MRASTVVSTVLSLALLSNQAVATPPACLLACVAQVTKASNTCNALNDVNCICSKQGDDVKKCLDSICPNGDSDAAYSAFKSSCSDQNVSVNQKDISSSASAKASSSVKASSTAKASSTKASSTKASSTKVSSSAAKATSTQIKVTSSSKAAPTTTSTSSTSSSTKATSTTLATSSKVQEVSSSSAVFSTVSVSEIHSGAGNYLQAGNSFAVAAIAALLI